MAKKVKLIEKTHQWLGKGIVRGEDATIKEIELGVQTTDKKLKETGAKELFKNARIPSGSTLIAVEVEKLDDVSVVYEMDANDFKEMAKVVGTQEDHEDEE